MEDLWTGSKLFTSLVIVGKRTLEMNEPLVELCIGMRMSISVIEGGV